MNGYPYSPDLFPGGKNLRIYDKSVASAIRQIWNTVSAMEFEIADQRPPVLPLTHKYVDASTTHGTVLAEKDIIPIPTGFLESRRYRSSAILVTMDAYVDPTLNPSPGMEVAVPMVILIQGGMAESVNSGGRFTVRQIESVAPDPTLQPVLDRLEHDLETLLGGQP